MARILLINLASLPMPGNEPIFPIGVRCVQDALTDGGHEVELMDFVERPGALDDLSWVRDGWDMIGFAIRNIDPIDLACDSHVADYTSFVGRVRAALGRERPLLVVGGPGYSLFAESLLAKLGLDIGVAGPGEAVMLRLAENPAAHVGRGKVIEGERYEPFTSRVLSHPVGLMRAYATERDAMIGVETLRRTCYQRCVYCPYAFISGKNAGDYKPLEVLRAEIEGIHAAGFRRIFFTDAIFNSQRYAKPIVRMLSEAGLEGLTWSAYFAPKPFDDEFASLLGPSGVENVVVSPDSLDPGLMKVLGKNFDLPSVERLIEKCRRHGLRTKVNIVFGAPGESRETVATTARFINENLFEDELSMHVGYRILPQTALAQQTGLREPELLAPTFLPLDDDILRWVMEALDSRFLPPRMMMNLLAGRASVRRMSKLPLKRSAAVDEIPYLALSRVG